MLLSLLLHGDAAPAAGMFGLTAAQFHAIMNDFPPAMLVMGVLFELAYLFTKRESLRGAAYWSLVIGAIMTANAIATGLKAEGSIQHGEAIHEIMEVHEKLAWITMGFFGVVAVWLVLRDSKMLRAERWGLALLGVVGLGFLTATGHEGGEMVFEHAAGMTTEAMEAEVKNRAAGHQHAEGEEHDEDHDAMPGMTDSTAARQQMDSAAATDTAPAAPAHTHAPGTPPHKD